VSHKSSSASPGRMKHPTDDDYGLFINDEERFVRVRLQALSAHSAEPYPCISKFHYACHGGRDGALRAARAHRDRMVKTEDVQRLISRSFAAPDRPGVHARTRRRNQQDTTCPGLIGVFLVETKKTRADGRTWPLYSIVGRIAQASAKQYSVGKYGVEEAVRRAAVWRAEQIGAAPPPEKSIREAADNVAKIIEQRKKEDAALAQQAPTPGRQMNPTDETSQTYRFILSRLHQAPIPVILEVIEDARVLLQKKQEQAQQQAQQHFRQSNNA